LNPSVAKNAAFANNKSDFKALLDVAKKTAHDTRNKKLEEIVESVRQNTKILVDANIIREEDNYFNLRRDVGQVSCF